MRNNRDSAQNDLIPKWSFGRLDITKSVVPDVRSKKEAI